MPLKNMMHRPGGAVRRARRRRRRVAIATTLVVGAIGAFPSVGSSFSASTFAGAAYAAAYFVPFGTALAAGDATRGATGTDDLDPYRSPHELQVAGTAEWVELGAGESSACGRRGDGTVWCWGANLDGQVGAGDRTRRDVPVQLPYSDWTVLDVGMAHACGIRSGGSLWCWGGGTWGKLGGGDGAGSLTPRQIVGSWSAIGLGTSHSCAVATTGTLWCWGHDFAGQLGNGAAPDQPAPYQVGTDTDWAQVGLGHSHSCAVKTTGTLWCWGGNLGAQLGLGAADLGRLEPAQVGVDADWVDVDAGSSTCAWRTDSSLWCWGGNDQGQIGDGTNATRFSPTAVAATPAGDWSGGSHGTSSTCAVSVGGELWCWGGNSTGQLGDGTTTARWLPGRVGIESDWVATAVGDDFTCGARSGGALWCWGAPTDNQIGVGLTRSTPAAVDGDPWRWVDLGTMSGCGIRDDSPHPGGTLWCWGPNASGELGVGDATPRWRPTQVGSATDWRRVTVGDGFACGIRAPGTLWCWGSNDRGQLGVGDTAMRFAPAQVGVASDWVAVSAGWRHACAVPASGAVSCWGAGDMGRLGDGSTVDRATPGPVGGGATSGVEVAAGRVHTCLVRTDRTAWCWGTSDIGQLGDGVGVDHATAHQVGSATNWSHLGAGENHTCATRTDGTLWCWGRNHDGQLGSDAWSHAGTPQRVGSETGWARPALGARHSCALRLGVAYCWGANPVGQLGAGTSVSTFEPAPVDAPGTATFVAAGDLATVVLVR